jgi:hypothetical protein
MTLRLKRSLSSGVLFLTGNGKRLGLVAELPNGTFVFKTKTPGSGCSAPYPTESAALEGLYAAWNLTF